MPRSAILVIDAQIGPMGGAYEGSSVIKAIIKTISKARESSGIVAFIQHCHSSYEPLMKCNTGWGLHPGLDKNPKALVVEKESSDSFYETPTDDLMAENDVEHVYITGIQTEYCVDTTSRVALSKGYSVTLVLANLAQPKSRIRVALSDEL